MIAYLPEIYEDELVYSWLCRYYVHSGALTHKMALSDIFCKRSDNPSKEFLGNINPEMMQKIAEIYPIKTLILEHTMFPQYARFVPLAQRKKALHHLEFDNIDVHHLFSVLPRSDTDRFMKYCPMCAEEDRQKYGETYWHRKHNIRGVTTCYKHGCLLEHSTVTAKSENTFTFCPAEEYAKITAPTFINPSPSQKFTEYITEVFDSPLSFKTDIPISATLYYAMAETKYMKSTGKMRNTQQFYNDLKTYYEEMGIENIASFYQIQRLLLGDRFDFSVVCQIAFFLGMSVKELTEPLLTEEQIKAAENTHNARDTPPPDWNAYDSELAPILENLAREIYNGSPSERPERVSERRIYQELNLSAHRLEYMPLCREILKRYSESYEECWARRILWAYQKLHTERNGSPFYWSDIRLLSGVKKVNLDKVIPYLHKHADTDTANSIIELIE